MNAPRVTIGMPVHQGERYLEEAIRSIRAQTFQDLELIIGDNGSSDATEEICRRHAAEDPRVRYHRSPVNRGASWNYNRLVPLARGEYFKWAAHDDLLRPTFVERCVEVLDARPGVLLAHTMAGAIDDRGAEFHRWPSNPNASVGPPSRRFADIVLREGECFPIFGLMRTEVLRRTELLGPYNGHDRPLMAELALHGRYAQVPEVLFLNRDHPDRSIRAYRGYRDRIAWFDPQLRDHVVYYHPRLALEYHRAIRRAAVPPTEAARAELAIARWWAQHVPGTARDVLGGLRAHVRHWRASSAAVGQPRREGGDVRGTPVGSSGSSP